MVEKIVLIEEVFELFTTQTVYKIYIVCILNIELCFLIRVNIVNKDGMVLKYGC